MNQNNQNVPAVDPVLEAKREQVGKEVERVITEGGFQLYPFIEHLSNGALVPRITIVPVPVANEPAKSADAPAQSNEQAEVTKS